MGIGDLLGTQNVTISKISPSISGTQPTEAYVSRSTGNTGRIVPLGGRLSSNVLGRFPSATHTLYLLGDVTIYPGDRVTDESNNDENSEDIVYTVLDVKPFHRGVETSPHHKECTLERVFRKEI